MPTLKIIHLEEVDSTNNYINKVEETNVIVVADFQDHGRGQGSNTWESERGKNLLYSIKISPDNLPANKFFVISMAGALAVKDAVSTLIDDVTLKWPNDIYWQDKKLSGTLIETTINGKFIQNCVLGIGINVNQREFKSDAPNPVSIWQITKKESRLDTLLNVFADRFLYYCGLISSGRTKDISDIYHASLYRKEGFHAYEDCQGVFLAKISRVQDNGHIILEDTEGNEREYEFKELRFK